MRFVIQRVNEASVKVDNKEIGSINKGFLVLIGVSNEDTKEIADKMNIPLGTVKSRIFIARKKAQAYLTEKPTAKSTTHKLVIKNAQSTLFSNGNRMDQKF